MEELSLFLSRQPMQGGAFIYYGWSNWSYGFLLDFWSTVGLKPPHTFRISYQNWSLLIPTNYLTLAGCFITADAHLLCHQNLMRGGILHIKANAFDPSVDTVGIQGSWLRLRGVWLVARTLFPSPFSIYHTSHSTIPCHQVMARIAGHIHWRSIPLYCILLQSSTSCHHNFFFFFFFLCIFYVYMQPVELWQTRSLTSQVCRPQKSERQNATWPCYNNERSIINYQPATKCYYISHQILHAILAGLWMLANCQLITINCYCPQVTSAAIKLEPGKTLYSPVQFCGRRNPSSLVLIHSLRPRVLPPIYLSAAGIPLYEDATPIATRFPSIRRKGKIDRNLCRSASNYVLHLSANVNLLVIGSFAYTSKSLHNCRSCVEGECAWDSTIFVFMFSIKDSALSPLSLRDFLGSLPGQRSCRASFVFAAVRVS